MGNSEEVKSSKSEKPSSPAPQDQTAQADPPHIHVHPDWAAMQAYYGSRVSFQPYYNSAVASGHAPQPYMWGPPQHMMPPYGAPYAAIYSHGSVYAHPAVSLGSSSQGLGVASSPSIAVTPLSLETPNKSSGNANGGLMKKLKGFDGLAMSIGNGSAESVEGGTEHSQSRSNVETENSGDGSDGNTSGENKIRGKRRGEGTPTTGKEGKTGSPVNQVVSKEIKPSSDKVLGKTFASARMTGNLIGPVASLGMSTALELSNPIGIAKTSPSSARQTCQGLPSEVWLQNEKELKRERRKQSNRESARRSRLRKQAETEELARKVESLTAEKMAIKSEIKRLSINSEKLKNENATLMGKLKNRESGRIEDIVLDGTDEKRIQPITTENLLSRVDNSGPPDSSGEEDGEVYKTNTNSRPKLHQLLGRSQRTDAVAAG